MKKLAVALTISISLIYSAPAFAQAPTLINFQGKLTDAAQAPVDGPTNILFSIYDAATGGTLLWSQYSSVTVNKGIFNVLLGSGTANGAAIPAPAYADLAKVFAAEEVTWLEVGVVGDYPMVPRQRLVSVAYSLHAQTAVDVPGMDITPNSVTIPAYGEVIDNSGQWTGVTIPSNKLDETDPTVAASVKNGVSWTELQEKPDALEDGKVDWSEVEGIPAGFADKKDDGILAETDPNVPAHIKDGISWGEISGIPAGFDDDVDNTGITSEADPHVKSTTANRIPKWDGNALVNSTSINETAAGYVGIGTSSPGARLDVAGNIEASAFFDRDNSGYYINPASISYVNRTRSANGSSPAYNDELVTKSYVDNQVSSASGKSMFVVPGDVPCPSGTSRGQNYYKPYQCGGGFFCHDNGCTTCTGCYINGGWGATVTSCTGQTVSSKSCKQVTCNAPVTAATCE